MGSAYAISPHVKALDPETQRGLLEQGRSVHFPMLLCQRENTSCVSLDEEELWNPVPDLFELQICTPFS